MSARVVLIVFAVAVPLTLAADAPTAEEITSAVRQLGDRRFAVREQATKRLWQAGSAAEAALREAAKNTDPEVSRRARELLDKIEWGIAADTPQEVVELIEKYRAAAAPAAKRQAVHDLVQKGRPGQAALVRIARRVSPDDRKALAAAMTAAAREEVPRLLRVRDYDAAGELLDACVSGDADPALTDYAAFNLLRGQLDRTIARWQGEPPPRRSAVLAVLSRARGDLAAARTHAAASGSAELLDDILWDLGDWADLARRPAPDGRAPAVHRATLALFHRLTGDEKALAAELDALRQLAKADEDWALPAREDPKPGDDLDLFVPWTSAKALCLVGRPAPALTLLGGVPGLRPQQIELLAAQLRFGDALAAAGKPGPMAEAAASMTIKRARLLYLLGDTDQAGQAFAGVAAGLRTADDVDTAVELAEAQVQLGLADAAREHIARFLGDLARQTASDLGPKKVLGAVFPKRGGEAWTWWTFFRQKFPQDEPAGTMKRVRALLDPPPPIISAGPGDHTAALLAALPPGEQDADARAHEALAAAHEAAGQVAAARAELTRAAERSKDAARWLRLGDFLATRKEYAAAANAYEQSAALDPAGPLAVYLHGRMLEKSGRSDEGRQIVEHARWLPLGNTILRADLAADLAKRGHDDLARAERDLVLKLGWPRVWAEGGLVSALARAAVARKDFAAAAMWYQRIPVHLMPDTQKDFTEASSLLAVPAGVHAYRSRAALAAGKLDVVKAEVDRSLALLPGNIDLALLLVPELDRLGHKADADALYARVAGAYAAVCKEYPNSPFAHNAAAWLSAGCRRDLDAAVEHGRVAVSRAPKNAGHLDTLAEVHFQRGEQATAIELMKKCLVLDPKNAYLAKQLRRFEAGDRDAPVPPEGSDD